MQARLAHRNLREQLANYVNLTLLTSREFAGRLATQASRRLTDAKKLELEEQEIARIRDTIQRATRAQASWSNRFEIASLNRDLLDCCFPELLIPRDRVQRRVVIDMDQRARLLTALLALTASLAIGWCLDINLSSMHRYYRTRLGLSFVVPSRDSELPACTRLTPPALVHRTIFLERAFPDSVKPVLFVCDVQHSHPVTTQNNGIPENRMFS